MVSRSDIKATEKIYENGFDIDLCEAFHLRIVIIIYISDLFKFL